MKIASVHATGFAALVAILAATSSSAWQSTTPMDLQAKGHTSASSSDAASCEGAVSASATSSPAGNPELVAREKAACVHATPSSSSSSSSSRT